MLNIKYLLFLYKYVIENKIVFEIWLNFICNLFLNNKDE